jgi:hypothetical protein
MRRPSKTALLISILIVVAVILAVRLACGPVRRVSTAKLLETARTGDLIMFRNTTHPWYYLAALPMTHIGVVIRYGGKPFVLEMHQFNDAPPGYPNLDGPHIYPLEVRIAESFNGGQWRLFYAPYLGPASTADVAWAFPPEYVPYKYDFIKDELRCHALARIPRVSTEKMHCANYAAMVLKKLGVAPPDARIDCVAPMEVMQLASYGTLQRVVR